MVIASKQVHSSHVDKIGYDPDNQTLVVVYKTGKTSVYQSVPQDIADQVMNSYSVGQALHNLVKGVYGHEYKG
jgi:hypothetical protein